MLSPDVVGFLSDLLESQTLQVGHPTFTETALVVIKARAELGALAEQLAATATPPAEAAPLS